MDEALRRAEREGEAGRLRALRERAGGELFAEGAVELPGLGQPDRLALSRGGRCLAALHADGQLQVWDVVRGVARYAREGVAASALLAQLDPSRVMWADAAGVHVWRPELESLERVHPAPEGSGGAALSGDGRWVGFGCADRVELHELDPQGVGTGERAVFPFGAPEDFGQSEHEYQAELVSLAVVESPVGPRFAAFGAETREQYCCSSEHHTHYLLRYGCFLFAGSAEGCWSLRGSRGDAGLEEFEEALELVRGARALVEPEGRVFVSGGSMEGLSAASGPDDFDAGELEGSLNWETLALQPQGGLRLCNRNDELVLLRPSAELGGSGPPEELFVAANAAGAAAFSPDGRHFAWCDGEGAWVASVELYVCD